MSCSESALGPEVLPDGFDPTVYYIASLCIDSKIFPCRPQMCNIRHLLVCFCLHLLSARSGSYIDSAYRLTAGRIVVQSGYIPGR